MKPKALLAIGVVAGLGAALWMREIASWRPHVVAHSGITQGHMTLSRDGRRLLVRGFGKNIMSGFKAVVIDLASESIDSKPQPIRRFWKSNAAPPPHLSLNPSQTQLIYTPQRGQRVLLAGKIHPHGCDVDPSNAGASNFAWSPPRGEIYRQYNGELRIWDFKTGRLKNRHSHWKDGSFQIGHFSPDGQSLLSFNRSPQGVNTLIRYDVPSGRQTAVIHRGNQGPGGSSAGYCGWSPDGKFLWFVRHNSLGDPLDFNVIRAADSQPLWSAPCAGASKWLPDGRIGVMQRDGFSWRDASGREIGRASGPLPSATTSWFGSADWEASPDGKWIYSMNDTDGTIRRWRAK